MCLCTGMLYDPATEDKNLKSKLERVFKRYWVFPLQNWKTNNRNYARKSFISIQRWFGHLILLCTYQEKDMKYYFIANTGSLVTTS
jgi:hypothetical protein